MMYFNHCFGICMLNRWNILKVTDTPYRSQIIHHLPLYNQRVKKEQWLTYAIIGINLFLHNGAVFPNENHFIIKIHMKWNLRKYLLSPIDPLHLFLYSTCGPT